MHGTTAKIEKCAFCGFTLRNFITMHGETNIDKHEICK